MKKYLLCSLVLMISLFLMTGKVHASETILVPFLGDDTQTITNGDFTIDEVDIGQVERQEAKTLKALVCDTADATQDTTTEKWTFIREKCSDTDVTYTISDESVATIQNGLLNFLTSGEAIVTCESADYGTVNFPFSVAVVEQQDENSDDVPNIEDDEEAGEVVKKNKVKKNSDVEKENEDGTLIGKQTKTNPETGIKDLMIILTPIAIVTGSAIVLKKRFA